MSVVLSVTLLFLLVLSLVVIYQSYIWNFSSVSFTNVRAWACSFECGFVSQGVSENYFSCSYFLLLVFFVLFDLEVSLLLNMPFEGWLYKNYFFFLFFLLCVCLGYLFEVKGGYIGWGE